MRYFLGVLLAIIGGYFLLTSYFLYCDFCNTYTPTLNYYVITTFNFFPDIEFFISIILTISGISIIKNFKILLKSLVSLTVLLPVYYLSFFIISSLYNSSLAISFSILFKLLAFGGTLFLTKGILNIYGLKLKNEIKNIGITKISIIGVIFGSIKLILSETGNLCW